MRPGHQRKREGIPLPVHHGPVTARVENFDALDSNSFNLGHDDAFDILGRLIDEFTIEYCHLSTDEIDMIPTLLEVPADARDKSVKVHFEFSRFETIRAERLLVYYNYKCT